MNTDPFKTLGLTEAATQDEIKKAYRDLSKRFHPDKNPDNKESEEKFKEISDAYSMIDSEQKVQEFKNKKNPLNWDATFTHIFGDFFGQQFRQPVNTTAFVTLTVSLQEIFTGVVKEFKYKVRETCKNCGGTGAVAFNQQGRPIKMCDPCRGQGATFEVKDARITIPRSAEHGTKVRAENSNVEATIVQIPDEKFARQGFNILAEKEIPLLRVFDGAEELVPTLHGDVIVKIPKFSQNGSMLRIKNKGLFDFRKNSYGDHIIKLKITIPNMLSPEACNGIADLLKTVDGLTNESQKKT